MCNNIDCALPQDRASLVEALFIHSGSSKGILNSDAAWRGIVHGYFVRRFAIDRHPVGDVCFEYLIETGDYIEAAQILAKTPGVLTPEQYERVKELTWSLVALGERHESDFNLFRHEAA